MLLASFQSDNCEFSKLDELMKQQAALEEKGRCVSKEEYAEALKEVRRLCKARRFTHNQLYAYLALDSRWKKGVRE